ncbi:MAG: terminase large subunit [Acidobacteriota bacterium]
MAWVRKPARRRGRPHGGRLRTLRTLEAGGGAQPSARRMMRLVRRGEPWSGPGLPGASSDPHLTQLLTGHDYFGDAFGRRPALDALLDLYMTRDAASGDTLQTLVLDACAQHARGGDAFEPWIERVHRGDDPHLSDRPTRTVDGTTYRFDPHAADRACSWIERYCLHTEGPWHGQPVTLLDWQRDVLGELFGWIDDDGNRQHWELQIWLSRKNGKTATLAWLVAYLYFSGGYGVPRARIAAGDRDQAGIALHRLQSLVRQSPQLARRAEVGVRSIRRHGMPRDATIEALSSRVDGAWGLQAPIVYLDEMHVVDPEMRQTLAGSMRSFPNGLLLVSSTVGLDPTVGARQLWEEAIETEREPARRPRCLARVYTAGRVDPKTQLPDVVPNDWASLAAIERANPSFPVTFSRARALEEIRQAGSSEAAKVHHCAMYLGIWPRRSATAFFDQLAWDRAARPDDAWWEGADVRCAGMDYAPLHDLTALAVLYDLGRGVYGVRTHAWLPDHDLAAKAKKDKAPYVEWVEAGHLRTLPGAVAVADVLAAEVRSVLARPLWRTRDADRPPIALDPSRAQEVYTRLMADGYRTIGVSGNARAIADAAEWLANKLQSGQLVHDGNPVSRWSLGQVGGHYDARRRLRLTKIGSRKNDVVFAILTAVAFHIHRALEGSTPAPTSRYTAGESLAVIPPVRRGAS